MPCSAPFAIHGELGSIERFQPNCLQMRVPMTVCFEIQRSVIIQERFAAAFRILIERPSVPSSAYLSSFLRRPKNPCLKGEQLVTTRSELYSFITRQPR